jgi:hypothetical protein
VFTLFPMSLFAYFIMLASDQRVGAVRILPLQSLTPFADIPVDRASRWCAPGAFARYREL